MTYNIKKTDKLTFADRNQDCDAAQIEWKKIAGKILKVL